MKTKLTQKNLDAAKSEAVGKGKPIYVWDTDLAGFGAYVSPKGDVSFLVQKWAGGRGGKAIRYVIGKTKNGMELPEARKLATGNIGDISKGANPVAVRRSTRQETRDRLNGTRISEALDLYIPDRANSRFKREKKKALQSAFDAVGLTKTPVADITKSDVRKMIARKVDEGKQAAARNLFAALRPFFSYCVDHEIITFSPMANMSSPSPVASRDRLLSSDEIKALWKASAQLSDTWTAFYRLLLLTGQRRDEVAGMTWSEIDLEKRIWTIPADRAKNSVAHVVHLSDPVVSILDETDEKERKGFVLPASRGEDNHISGYSKMKRDLDTRMGKILDGPLTPWRIHDLRRTMASGLAEMGYPTDVADRLLNHVSGSRSGVKGVYQRYEFMRERKEAIEAWGKRVMEITSGH